MNMEEMDDLRHFAQTKGKPGENSFPIQYPEVVEQTGKSKFNILKILSWMLFHLGHF